MLAKAAREIAVLIPGTKVDVREDHIAITRNECTVYLVIDETGHRVSCDGESQRLTGYDDEGGWMRECEETIEAHGVTAEPYELAIERENHDYLTSTRSLLDCMRELHKQAKALEAQAHSMWGAW